MGGGDLDYMDVTHLMTELTRPWEVTENPATKFARDDKIERQLIKAGLATQPNLWLALAMSAFKATGEYDAQIGKFEAKATADKTFDNFRLFIVNKYAKRSKQDKSTAKSVGFGIATTAVAADIPNNDIQAAEAAWAISEVANAIQAAQDKQNDRMMEMFKQMMAMMSKDKLAASKAAHPNQATLVAIARHASIAASNMADQTCNVGNWRSTPPVAQLIGNPPWNARKTSEGAWSTRSLSSGSQARLKSIK